METKLFSGGAQYAVACAVVVIKLPSAVARTTVIGSVLPPKPPGCPRAMLLRKGVLLQLWTV